MPELSEISAVMWLILQELRARLSPMIYFLSPYGLIACEKFLKASELLSKSISQRA